MKQFVCSVCNSVYTGTEDSCPYCEMSKNKIPRPIDGVSESELKKELETKTKLCNVCFTEYSFFRPRCPNCSKPFNLLKYKRDE